MANCYNERDLDSIPDLTFTFVENYVKSCKSSSGQKSVNKGFKYFSEGYIHDLKVQKLSDGCEVSGKCFRSQKRNEPPHAVKIVFGNDDSPTIRKADCSCPIGLSEACGHITGLLYQLAKYKVLNLKALPEDVAKTSQAQTWHTPRGENIKSKEVQDLEVVGYRKVDFDRESAPRTVKSTLYNPVRGGQVDWCGHHSNLSEACPDMLILPALKNYDVPIVNTKFGKYPKGSVLSYHQPLESNCIINIYDGISFPDLPLENVMQNEYSFVLTESQLVKFEGLKLQLTEIKKFEEQTRLQSLTPLWFRVRRHRITASHMGEICKRRKDHEALATRLKTTRRCMTAAMRRGHICEPIAGKAYATKLQNKVNLYPCGVVVNLWSPWIAASPDRKVYNPERNPPFGLLEIKCPIVQNINEVKCLKKDADGHMKLKRNDNYFYQIMTQMAVTGLKWCDFYVWWETGDHLESIFFDDEVWQETKNKADDFYFRYFI